ncbi:hypothetical protein [Tenacibaculum sp. 190524A05c]|uniref:hypothetical protein n=1 Tax=Tenacibaculum platacis TaxID=3137852 RepID=UPI0032B13BDC
MKKNLLLLSLIFNQVLFSQNIHELKFRKSIKFEVSESINQYLLTKSDKNKLKLDSIKKIERKNLIENIIGKWEYFGSDCSCCVKLNESKIIQKYIVISKNEISFYNEKISNKNITNIELIEFSNQFDSFSELTELVYKDKTIWTYKTDSSKDYMKIYRNGEETNSGRTRQISGITIDYYKRMK